MSKYTNDIYYYCFTAHLVVPYKWKCMRDVYSKRACPHNIKQINTDALLVYGK